MPEYEKLDQRRVNTLINSNHKNYIEGVKNVHPTEKVVFRKIDFSGIRISGILCGIEFIDCKLSGCVFSDTSLNEAEIPQRDGSFKKHPAARFDNTSFEGASFQAAKIDLELFKKIYKENKSGKGLVLSSLSLVEKNFSGFDLQGISFENVDLTNSKFIKTNLKDTQFDSAILYGASHCYYACLRVRFFFSGRISGAVSCW
jgi:uncharacterized protein YjbI with pentapeptide repeats